MNREQEYRENKNKERKGIQGEQEYTEKRNTENTVI